MPTRLINRKLTVAYPAISALLIGFLIIFLIPPIFEKYKAEVIDHQNIFSNNHLFYKDINSDSYSERISISAVNNKYTYVNFYDEKNALLNVWNLHGKVQNESLSICDFDNDGKSEVYLITLFADSLFLNRYEVTDKHRGKNAQIFITTIPKHYERPDCGTSAIIHRDVDGDGNLEAIFSVYGEYSLQPRSIYCYNWKKRNISHTISSGVILEEVKSVYSFEDDHLYFTGDNSTTNFIIENDSIPYPDNKAWFMVYDEKMKLAFEPINLGNQGTYLEILPIKNYKEPYFVVLQNNHFKTQESNLYCFSTKGDIISQTLENNPLKRIKHTFRFSQTPTGHFYTINSSGEVHEMNHHLKSIHKFDIHSASSEYFYTANIDSDPEEELIQWMSSSKHLTFYQPDFRNPTTIKLPELKSKKLTISLKKTPKEKWIVIKDYNHAYQIKYSKNKTYFLKYVLYASIFIFIYLIIYAIQKSHIIRSLEKERNVSQLKLMTLKNQIDPHFTLNALNAIGLSILNDQKETSYNNLQRFSQLIRNTLIDADSITRTLEDEVRFVKDYISIMQIRYADKFDAHFEIDEEVDMMIQVPKMILQSFVENALNHGIRPKTGKGNLYIRLNNKGEGVEISIEDDGIGRAKAASLEKESTGKGIEIVTDYLTLFNKFNKNKTHYRIIDLFQNRHATGTKVLIYIPEHYDYQF